ncbi:putative phosphatidate phosphatase isoform X2 [Stegodyphus dumicola]|uniref:putative phosphatidate phosphatase isoform X2 n=1 Tax=Stegodyphus dumicola TaxID=202533 RepID=UPI0015AF05A0|nr:putative phosphatidate phosphatase isoform X2 [Stegodyphus dumicola]
MFTFRRFDYDMPKDHRIIAKILLDLAILLTVGIPILLFHLHGQPIQRGFFCDDDSIRYPFKESTISNKVLYIVGIFVPVIVISLTEFANDAMSKRENRGQINVILGRTVPTLWWKIYKNVGVFLYGACMSQLTTDIAKYSIGRLRPHFIDVCRPDVDCLSAVQDAHLYQDSFNCTGKDLFRIREARLSFPSGHSSFSAYTMVFTVIYLQACMRCKVNKLLRPFLQFILMMMTWYTALSRIADFKHHWSDVLVGFLQGTIMALITAFFVADIFTKEAKKEADIILQNISTDGPAPNYNTMDTSTDVESRSQFVSK